jgi:hypothetical protein
VLREGEPRSTHHGVARMERKRNPGFPGHRCPRIALRFIRATGRSLRIRESGVDCPKASDRTLTELRVYLKIVSLRRQFAAYMGSPTRGRGYVPLEGMHSLIVEIAPALAIHHVTDVALKSVPEAEPGMLYTERQFGILEVHSRNMEDIDRAGAAVLAAIGGKASDQLKPQLLYSEIVERVSDAHAVILNRNREASMMLPGESLLLVEMAPALFAAHAANEAERVAPRATLVDCQMIGASGRLFMAGEEAELETAREHIVRSLSDIEGR